MTTAPSTTHHGTHWRPQSRLGRWATTSVATAVGITVALSVGFAAGLDRPESMTDSWLVLVAGAATVVGAGAAAVTGLLAMTRSHDRSWSVAVATGLGLLLTLLMLQQVGEGLGWLTS